MKEYHIKDLKSVSTTKLFFFQEKDNDSYMYERLVIDEGYKGMISYDKPKFGFVLERVDKVATKYNSLTMTEFKKRVNYMSLITDLYSELKNVDCSYEIPEDKQIYIRAQTEGDIYESQFDGAHCSLVLKLVAFRCIKRGV